MQALPYLIFLGVFLAAFKWLEAKFNPKKRGRWRRSSRWDRSRRGEVHQFPPKHDALPDRAMDAADQLRTVMKAEFKAQPLLNKSETRLFKALDKMVIEMAPPGWQVMAQVSLGEFLASEDREAYACINSKRVDFALMDADCRVRHALEYQGSGHHQGSAAARDAVKKEALRKAGVGYHEVVAGHTTPAELKRLVEKLVPGA